MPDNRQLEIPDDLLKTAERNFDSTVKHAGTVEDKAQKTSGLASIFLAVAFGFVKPESLQGLQQQYGNTSLILLFVVLFLLVGSIIACLFAMWQREVPVGGVSLDAHEEVAGLVLQFAAKDINDDLLYFYKTNQLDIWRSATEERFCVNKRKARLVLIAQNIAGAGIAVAVMNIGLMGLQLWRGAILF